MTCEQSNIITIQSFFSQHFRINWPMPIITPKPPRPPKLAPPQTAITPARTTPTHSPTICSKPPRSVTPENPKRAAIQRNSPKAIRPMGNSTIPKPPAIRRFGKDVATSRPLRALSMNPEFPAKCEPPAPKALPPQTAIDANLLRNSNRGGGKQRQSAPYIPRSTIL